MRRGKEGREERSWCIAMPRALAKGGGEKEEKSSISTRYQENRGFVVPSDGRKKKKKPVVQGFVASLVKKEREGDAASTISTAGSF